MSIVMSTETKMGRLRATLSTTPIDRAVQSHVAVAHKALRQALDVCASLGQSEKYAPAYVSRVRRDLLAALGAVERIRRVVPRFDLTDPDLQPTASYERPASSTSSLESTNEANVIAEE